tara:strand:- start:50 stop:325 length:276 start_codon:yes stop_codon:yes gene_type:complete
MSNKEEAKFKLHLFGTALFSFIMSIYYVTEFNTDHFPDTPLNFFLYTFLFWIVGFFALGIFVFVLKIKKDMVSFYFFYLIVFLQPIILKNL